MTRWRKGCFSNLHQSSGARAHSSSDKLCLIGSVALTFAFACVLIMSQHPFTLVLMQWPITVGFVPSHYLQRLVQVLQQVYNELNGNTSGGSPEKLFCFFFHCIWFPTPHCQLITDTFTSIIFSFWNHELAQLFLHCVLTVICDQFDSILNLS